MKKIPLTRGVLGRRFATCDTRDFSILSRYKWRAVKFKTDVIYAFTDLYVIGSGREYKRYTYGMHQMVMGHRALDTARLKFRIDHIDHDGLNNRRNNLRWLSNRLNVVHQKHRPNKLGRGVARIKCKSKPFMAQITTGTKIKYLGIFATAKEAREAYDRAAKKYFGNFAVLNRDHFKIPKQRHLSS